jgi:hypothetical protein
MNSGFSFSRLPIKATRVTHRENRLNRDFFSNHDGGFFGSLRLMALVANQLDSGGPTTEET